MTISNDTLLDIYERLCLCREFESALISYGTRDRASLGHPYLGQEAVAAGACAALGPEDRLLSTHRSHGHAVAKGCDLIRLALELYGSVEGTCLGRAGEMYMCEPDVGYLGGTQIVAGNLPMAAGVALAGQLAGGDQIAIGFVGDGGVNQGVFYETLNLASVWHLPLVVVVEDNGYAQSTPAAYVTAGSIVERVAAFGINARRVDGQAATEVYEAVTEARQRAMAGDGPTVLHAETYRYEGHYYGDRHRRYRDQTELEHWLSRDPLSVHRGVLQTAGIDEERISSIEREAKALCVEAFEGASSGRRVTADDLTGWLNPVGASSPGAQR
ncbi:MAG: Pyruvate dehydrogenase (acetyl-transferring) [Acidimicrobiaceae bacterium]|nr:Pyruvate dehydrogenase (acetyl-transferring) [Acidimicrobiaceae bacterium]